MVAQSTTPNSSASVFYTNANGSPAFRNGSAGWNGQLVSTITSTGAIGTSTLNTYVPISGTFTVPAGDAQTTTIYRVRLYFSGTMSTAGGVNIGFLLDGTAVAAAGVDEGTGVPSGVGFTGWAEAALIIVTTGSSGTCWCHISGSASKSGRADTSGGATFGAISTSIVAINTTVSHTLAIAGNWITGSTGSPNIAGFGSSIERVGP
jgi:hypothetical protein